MHADPDGGTGGWYVRTYAQWGLVNFDASMLWVRDRTLLTDALDVTPEFLRSKQGDEGAYCAHPTPRRRPNAQRTFD